MARAVPDVGIRLEDIELPAKFFHTEGNAPMVVTRLHMKDGCFFLARDVKKLLGPGSESGNHALLSRLQRSDGSKGTRKTTMEEFRYLALRLGLKGGLPLLVAAACLQPVLQLRQVPEDIIERLTTDVDLDVGATAHRRTALSAAAAPRRDARGAPSEVGPPLPRARGPSWLPEGAPRGFAALGCCVVRGLRRFEAVRYVRPGSWRPVAASQVGGDCVDACLQVWCVCVWGGLGGRERMAKGS